MDMNKTIIQSLLKKYANHQISKEEYDKLLSFIKKNKELEDIGLVMDEDWKNLTDEFPFAESRSERLYQKIISNTGYSGANPAMKSTAVATKIWSYVSMVAAMLALVTIGIFIYTWGEKTSSTSDELVRTNNIVSGSNKATLTMGNGKKIQLSESKSGVLVEGNNVTYNDGAAIGVLADGESDPAVDRIQTITTPKGGTYQVTLSDGTRVWLNAASSLTYSSNIIEHGFRTVSLTGEGYFEVSKDKAHPFVVQSKGQRVKVLGTHFNISSYAEEKNVKTTLLEGSVQVNEIFLKPNEQSILENNRISVIPVDAEKMVAWKNGKFVFNSESIESIMNKLSRWYNVEIIYKGDFSDKIFTGSMSRYDDISKILETITFTQAVHFKIEGRRITVMP